ncbi:MAG: acetyl-CoA decarbonylase/synthase complex subunit gamma [Euryarchaeota archaeon]|nr:acetyl-CoA decarbonylase/synthase complex subunit gamma [Euryarchaeota archaeon]
MATAIEIFKLLPKKNCGKCNFPTCLAFAMQLANQKVKLSDCPFVSDEAKAKLEASSAPPIHLVTIGSGDKKVEIGDETELYRHEKKFFHPTCYAITISDSMSDGEVESKLKRAEELSFERIGQVLTIDLMAVRNDSDNDTRFAEVVSRVAEIGLPLVLMSERPEAMKRAVEEASLEKPLLYAATEGNIEAMSSVAKELACPLALRADDLETLAKLAVHARETGVEDLILDLAPHRAKDLVEKNTIVRKNAIKRTFDGLGYPIILNVCDDERAVLKAMLATMKYGSIVLFDDLNPAHALPLFVLRQNIYTDPQVPIQVRAGLYPVNDPGPDDPILFTTNFSLTYFTVMGDVDKAKVPAWLLVVDTEGLSVLTAYSAGKLTEESVVEALEETSAKEKSTSGILIIPGLISRMSGKLQELSGMRVIVGPRESSGIPKLLRSEEF